MSIDPSGKTIVGCAIAKTVGQANIVGVVTGTIG